MGLLKLGAIKGLAQLYSELYCHACLPGFQNRWWHLCMVSICSLKHHTFDKGMWLWRLKKKIDYISNIQHCCLVLEARGQCYVWSENKVPINVCWCFTWSRVLVLSLKILYFARWQFSESQNMGASFAFAWGDSLCNLKRPFSWLVLYVISTAEWCS